MEHPRAARSRPQSRLPRLPPELLLAVVDSVAGSARRGEPELAYPASHAVTKTLLALARTSRAVSQPALQSLYEHCLYIDSLWRCERLAYAARCTEAAAAAAAAGTKPERLLPPPPTLRAHSACIVAGVFDDPWDGEEPNGPHPLQLWLAHVAPVLRRLVWNRDCARQHGDQAMLGLSADVFASLHRLESLCSVCHSLDGAWAAAAAAAAPGAELDPPWQHLRQLRVLALYNPLVDRAFVDRAARLPHLRSLVLTRPDGLDELDVRKAWRRAAGPHRPLEIVVVNTWADHRPLRRESDQSSDDDVSVRLEMVPTSYYGDLDDSAVCKHWVLRMFMSSEEPCWRGDHMAKPPI